MLKAEDLLQVRKVSNNYNGCPKYVSIEACRELFTELGLNPSPKAVGTLGDIMENFAIAVLRSCDKEKISKTDLEKSVNSIISSI